MSKTHRPPYGLASGIPERRGDTFRYGPLILAAARVAGIHPNRVIHIDEVLAVLTDADPARLDTLTWGDLIAIVSQAVAITESDPRNWRHRANARGFTAPGRSTGIPTAHPACGEAVADEPLHVLADRLVVEGF